MITCYNYDGDKMKYIKLALQGFIIGIGKIIPGVSGAMFAMLFGVYEKALKIISNLRKELKGNFLFMTVLGLSVLSAIIFGSNIINRCLNTYYIQTMFLFLGMMVAGIKSLFQNIKGKKIDTKSKAIAFFIAGCLVAISFIDISGGESTVPKNLFSIIMLFICGFLDIAASIIPGICGTALLMILGYYNTVISALGNILDIGSLNDNLFILAPFLVGMIVGAFIISKMISYLFRKYKDATYYAIFCFAIASIIILFVQTITTEFTCIELFISIILFIIGWIIVKLLDKIK